MAVDARERRRAPELGVYLRGHKYTRDISIRAVGHRLVASLL
jgi:hypothetical protein